MTIRAPGADRDGRTPQRPPGRHRRRDAPWGRRQRVARAQDQWWTSRARWRRASSRSGTRSRATSTRAASGAPPSPCTATGARSSTCGAAPDATSTATEPWRHGHRADRALRHQGRRRRRTAAARTSAASSTSTRRSAPTGPSSRRAARNASWSGTCSPTGPGVPALDRPLTPAEAVDGESAAAAVAAQTPRLGAGHRPRLPRPDLQLADWASWSGGSPGAPSAVDRRGDRPAARPRPVARAAAGAGRPGRPGRRGSRRRPPPGGLRTRPKRSVAEAYADPQTLTRRAFAAITPLPDENDPAYRAAVLPASTASPPPTASPASTPR